MVIIGKLTLVIFEAEAEDRIGPFKPTKSGRFSSYWNVYQREKTPFATQVVTKQNRLGLWRGPTRIQIEAQDMAKGLCVDSSYHSAPPVQLRMCFPGIREMKLPKDDG